MIVQRPVDHRQMSNCIQNGHKPHDSFFSSEDTDIFVSLDILTGII